MWGMREQLSIGGRRAAGFGLGVNLGTTVDATSVLSSLGADPSTVYTAYQAQQGFAQMGGVFARAQAIEDGESSCAKNCGTNLQCQNDCNKAAVLAVEALATSLFAAFNPIVGLVAGALFAALNSVFGFAQGVGDPSCPNGPLPWPPSAADQAALSAAAATIFAGTTAPGGASPEGVTDPFLLSVMAFRAQQSALIENCHWDQALSGTGTIAAQAVLLEHWNAMHFGGSSETITRTVLGNGPPPADYDQWSFFISDLYYGQNPSGKGGDVATIVVGRGSLSPLILQGKGGAGASTSSTGATVVKGAAVVAGAGAAGILAYALYHGISYADAARKLWKAIRGG
jgi:hypothetical protein